MNPQLIYVIALFLILLMVFLVGAFLMARYHLNQPVTASDFLRLCTDETCQGPDFIRFMARIEEYEEKKRKHHGSAASHTHKEN